MTISPRLKFKIEDYVVGDNRLPTQSYALKVKVALNKNHF